MKHVYLALTVVLLSGLSMAQSTVPRIPVYEVFSSSTCPPCRPANEHLTPIFEEFKGEIAVVKYQMSWPGAGDPYYTSEGNSRRNYYGVTGVPAFYRNAAVTAYSGFTSSSVEADLQEESSMRMDLRYMIDTIAQSIRIRARIEALDDFTDGGQRLMIPIIEQVTYNNKETNGESEFHNVFKKMLPETQGEIIIGNILEGDTMIVDTTYVFQGDYRLPSNASDQIDHETEHSVEEFDDLHVIMYMQSLLGNKSIYQGAIGVREYSVANMDRGWEAERIWPTAIEEVDESGFSVFPNPANDYVLIAFEDVSKIDRIVVRSITGNVVFEQGTPKHSRIQLSTSELSDGIYMIEVDRGGNLAYERVAIQH